MASVKLHLPLITTRISFSTSHLPPRPEITLRQDYSKTIKRQIRRSRTPYTHQRHGHEHPQLTPPTRGSSPELSELSELEESDAEGGAKDKIPKPPGEAGRSGCGGFNLEEELGWEKDRYTTFIKYVNNLVATSLDAGKCFSNQKASKLQETIQKVILKFEISDTYENDWPVREALKLRLKYTSEQARKSVQKSKEKNLRKAVRAANALGRKDNSELSTPSDD